MLTKYYPYGTGEAFIENEIKILSERYENNLFKNIYGEKMQDIFDNAVSYFKK